MTTTPTPVRGTISEAAKTAREVYSDSCNHTHDAIDYMEQLLLTAIQPDPAPQPVAWQLLHHDGVWLDVGDAYVDHYRGMGQQIRPLYATPSSAGMVSVEAAGWQPIETAPETDDCAPLIWLWEPHEMGGFMFAGTRNNAGKWINNIDMMPQSPTHWMPLPEPPALRALAGER